MKQPETGAGRSLRRVYEAVEDVGFAGSPEERYELWHAQYEKKGFMARKDDYRALKARCISDNVDVGDVFVAAVELLLADPKLWEQVKTRAAEIDDERPRKR